MSKSSRLYRPALICSIAMFSLAMGYLYQLTTFIVRGDFSDLGITPNQPVLVYSRTDCTACQALKAMLADYNVATRYIELDQQPAAQDLKNFSALGYQQVPIIITRNSLILGYHQPAILLALTGI